ncbi:MAG: hypothetical protein ACRDTM_16385 [Micromonosporaceae bacterium]
MAIAEVKTGMTSAANNMKQAHAELQTLREEIGKGIARVRSATRGTTRDEVDQAIAVWQRAHSELDHAGRAITTGVDHAETYAARI